MELGLELRFKKDN